MPVGQALACLSRQLRGHKEWRGWWRESRELGCWNSLMEWLRRPPPCNDKSNGAERGGDGEWRVPAPRDLAEHWIGGDERRVSVDRRPRPAVPATGGTSGTPSST